ncbi:MAG: hypothetical protein HY018_04510 [Hydrogenophilales bacterium]|nr:hypothetical protein [Hydrogenophilales bacterium]
MESQEKATVNEIPKAKGVGATAERSTIEFPYSDLDSAIEIVRGVHEVGGTACEYDQLAAHMGLEAKGGGFRIRVTSAKIYGLLNYERGGRTSLTDLGIKIIDPQSDKPARAEAFLKVPLFAKVFEEFKGRQLPPQAGLERAMITYGVGAKVAKNARQVLMRSAKQAGYFDLSQDRLTAPPIRETEREEKKQKPPGETDKKTGGDDGGSRLHPAFQLLLQTLPDPGTEWDAKQRMNWLVMANSAFNMIYKSEQDAKEIEINLKP